MTEPALAKIERGAETFQWLGRKLGTESLGMSAVTLEPGQRLRVHRHERQEEVYLVLEGTLTLIVEGEPHELGPDAVARVAPEMRRQLTNAHPERLVVLAVGASGEHRSRDGIAWASWDEEGPGRPPKEVPMFEERPADRAAS